MSVNKKMEERLELAEKRLMEIIEHPEKLDEIPECSAIPLSESKGKDLEEIYYEEEWNFTCPKCGTNLELKLPANAEDLLTTFCPVCYEVLVLDRRARKVEIGTVETKYKAFYSHSAMEEDREVVRFFETMLKLFGVSVYKVEDDYRPIPALEKIEEGIKQSDFVFVILTKRYKYEAYGQYGWKSSEYIQNEIGMAYAYHKPIVAVAEEGVDVEGILPDITWYHRFNREELLKTGALPSDFFEKLERVLMHVEEEERRKKEREKSAALVALGLTFAFLGGILAATAGIGIVSRK
mgnify:CR=1 FL=1